MVSPSRSRAIQSAFGTRTPEVVPFQAKTTSRSQSTCAKSGSSPSGAIITRTSGSLQLLDDVGHPFAAEGIESEHIDAAGAEQRPQRHLHRAGVRRRHDADAIVRRQPKQLARLDERQLEPRLRLLGAMVAAEQRALQRLDAPAGMLGARAGGEARIGWPDLRLRCGRSWPASLRRKKAARRSDGRSRCCGLGGWVGLF